MSAWKHSGSRPSARAGDLESTPSIDSVALKIPSADAFPIVGIGASAGGLADLISRFTPMRVVEVGNGMEIRPNCVYIIPPNRDLVLSRGQFQLLERTSTPEEVWIQLEVEDTGGGMTPDILEHAMEPFFTTKPVGRGTGLGLSTSYGIIQAHGGTLEITSQPGKGTHVKIRLPRISGPFQQEALPERTQNFGPLKILLVDDEAFIRSAYVPLLEMAGFQAWAVEGGQEALDSIASGAIPDVILLDVNMPKMDGIQTLARIRTLLPNVPVLIASGRQDLHELVPLPQPHVALLQKPYTMKDIRAKLGQKGFLE